MLILARNLYFAISFLLSIDFDSLNYYFLRYRIVLINYNNISKDSYFNKLITIKTNLKIKLKLLLRLIKINYSKTLIDLYYQISQMRSLRSNFSFVFLKTTITRFNLIVLNILNKLAFIIKKLTRIKILIKRIIFLIKNIIIKKIKNTMLKTTSSRRKIIT